MGKGSRGQPPDDAATVVNDEDAWKLDDSDHEGDVTKEHIARVAAQAGLGRKSSGTSLNTRSTSMSATESNGSATSSAAGAVGATPSARTFSSAANNLHSAPAKRQQSVGFWERLSGFGVGMSSAGTASGTTRGSEAASNEPDAEASGYARFDDTLELEDNFDGTYSINAGSTIARPASTGASQAKLGAPVAIARPSLLGSANAKSTSSLPRLRTPSSISLGKGKNKVLESPIATIVGSPRTRTSTKDKPRDEQDMRRAVRKNLAEIIEDPIRLLQSLSISKEADRAPAASTSTAAYGSDYYNPNISPPVPSVSTMSSAYDSPLEHQSSDAAAAAVDIAKQQAQARRDATRREKFITCLSKPTVDIAELRKLAWAGIPIEVRPIAWQLLLGYLPAPASRRISVLARKRQEYADAVRLAFSRGEASLDATLWHQIEIDVPRTNPGVPLWQFVSTQKSLERILYVWAIRHPASGYVQGINDLATPFFQVFLSAYIDCAPEDYDISSLPEDALSALEADTFWCLSKLLDGIQDNYIFAQPGIHRQVARCQELCFRVDAALAKHLEAEGVTFLQFSFRWFHLLFLRVLPVNAVIRMWDTYMSEGSDAFANFHTYVCLAFLLRWSEKLRSMDFQAIMLFLQDPVDHETWTESMTELLLSEAYMWSALWSGSK